MNAQGLPQPPPGAPRHCPECAASLATAAHACQNCGLSLVGPTAQRLWWIDTEIEMLRGRERALVQERPVVLNRLRQESRERARQEIRERLEAQELWAAAQQEASRRAPDPLDPIEVPAAPPAPATPGVPGVPARPPVSAAPATAAAGHAPAPAAPGRSGEVSRRSAQNIILGLGGLLVGIAALVFAIWTWSDMGTGTRAAVLGLTTLAFAGLAHPLYRRGLHATAETFGAVAAGLLCVDALALWLLSDQITNGPGYTAAALAVMSTLLALYPALVPLSSPRVLAALFLQPVPVLLVIALPSDGNPGWLLAVIAATALADVLVLRRLGPPRPGVPVRTLRVAALILWGLALFVTVVTVLAAGSYSGEDPLGWWSLATTLFLTGITALLVERRRAPAPAGQAARDQHASGTPAPGNLSVFTVLGLLSLALMPLVAGPAHLPVLPRLTAAPWSLEPAAMATPAVELLQLDRVSTLPPLSFVYLAGILVATALALGAVWLLHRSALLLTLSLTAPAALLAVPLLLGLPQAVAAVWALVVGGCLVLGSALLGRWTGAVPVITGTLTLLTGLVWALPERYTTLAAVLMLAVTALVCAAGARRFTNPVRRPEPGDRTATLYMAGTLLWGLALLVGGAYLVGNRGADGTAQVQWWLLTAAVLLCGATALMLSRVPTPSSLRLTADGHQSGTDLRPLFTLIGLGLLPVAPLLALPERSPALTLFADRTSWSEPVQAMWEPVHAVLGLPAQPSVLFAVGSALGVLLVGALVVALVAVIERRWLPNGLALVVPPTLVPLPVLLGAPFAVAVVWTVLVGAALLLWVPRLRASVGWLPGVTGLATMLLALSWSLPEQHTTLIALLLVATVALLSALTHQDLRAATAVPGTGGTWPADAGGSVAALVSGLTMVTWGATLLFGLAALIASAAVGAPGQVPWWLLGAVTLLLGATALVLDRTERRAGSTPDGGAPSAFGIGALLLLAAVPPLVGPRGLPTIPALGPDDSPFDAPTAAMLAPARELVGLPVPADTLTALLTALGMMVAGSLALSTVLLLGRGLLTPAITLVGALTLVPLPVLLGAPFAVAVVWTVLVGAALLLWVPRLRASDGWLPGTIGLATMLLALSWSLPEQHTTLIALLLVATVALLSALTHRGLARPSRTSPGPGGSPERLVYGLTALTWGAGLLFGFAALVMSAADGSAAQLPYWLLGALALLLGATAMVLGRTDRERAAEPDRSGVPASFSVVGLLLAAIVPLLVGPRGVTALAPFSWIHGVYEAPLSALLDPVHVFLGLPAPNDTLSMFTVPLGLLVAALLVLGTVLLLDRTLLVPTAALVLPLTLIPLPVAVGATFLAALVWTLAVGSLLFTGSALLREGQGSWMPWMTGLATLALALSWSVSERYSTVAVLLAVAAAASVVTALARTRFVAIASTSVAVTATGGFALTLPLALNVPVEYAAFGPIAVVAAVAVVAPRLRSPLVEAAEVPASVWAALALGLTVLNGTRLELVAVALAVVGVVSLASAVRPGRRGFAVVGAALMFLALWTALASWNVTVPEAYTVPPALAFLVIGWEWSRKADETPPSWLAYGGGLALLLGPTVWLVLIEDDLVWRVPTVLAVGLAVTVWGLFQRLQAALVIGGLALLVTSLRAFGPPLWELTQLMPNWLPFAVIGVLLLIVGARYEASLTRLRQVGRMLSEMR
ncbi:hypothetical protein NE857_06470 [Nocardiopsis exhalans]|uniref:Integral membrane protein n=1 Tax=Nocardiopsis exhalans TaxID=163604 RepID=A0ABY5DD04_9ACTN|nr:hypothetical protein [Nocardiopsis exhalans]USY21265.1 hypothetical protein NE857_06470 [Nocardiopsis exhalans]